MQLVVINLPAAEWNGTKEKQEVCPQKCIVCAPYIGWHNDGI